jgi:Spy/CpxP family protein refolding chaperone
MKANRKLIATLASTALLTASTLALFAQRPDSSNWVEQRVAKRVVARIESKLNLTEDQKVQVKSVLQSEKPAILALAAQAGQEREELAALPAFDDAQVRAISEKYNSTNISILVERTKLRLQLRAVLNDSQRRQLDTLRARIGANAGERLSNFIDLI